MQEKSKYYSLFFEVFVHVTEDLEKVREALLFILPEEYRKRVSIKNEILVGSWGNQIIVLKLKNKGEDIVRETLSRIFYSLSAVERENILSRLFKQVDEKGCFYLRISKQNACLQRVSLDQDGGIIRCIFKFKTGVGEKKSEAIRYLKEMISTIENEML